MNAVPTTPYADRIRALPCWTGRISVEPLKGGLSNETFLVEDNAGKHVVRFGVDFPFHHVSRERELMAARAAHAAGVAPQVEYAQAGVMVCAFIDAKTCDGDDVRANRARVAAIVKRFHETMPRYIHGPGYMFWVFHVIRDYARTLVAARSRMASECPSYLALADELEEAQAPLPVIFGHNDLLPANLMDDGHRLWLIDFEYAGFNTAMFDLAGLASNAGMTADESADLFGIYFGKAPDAAMKRAYSAMQCASLLREAMWSMVSEIHMPATDIDYVAYTNDNLNKLRAALESHQKYRRKKK